MDRAGRNLQLRRVVHKLKGFKTNLETLYPFTPIDTNGRTPNQPEKKQLRDYAKNLLPQRLVGFSVS